MFWIGLIIGLIVGACLGITIYGLMAISKWANQKTQHYTIVTEEREEEMDMGNGQFEQLNKEDYQKLLEKNPNRPIDGLFREGEELLIKNSHFRVQSIRPKKMILRLLKRNSD